METKIKINHLSFMYGTHRILNDISVQFPLNKISTIIGPSGIGKSTFLTVINRLWESVDYCNMHGNVEIQFDGEFKNIYEKNFSAFELRRRVGTVFQTPNPLPMSIYKNVAFPLKLLGKKDKDYIDESVENSLKQVQLWDEVKNRLSDNALKLSGGQQQRLCIARALMLNPEVMLFDEPTSSLDEKSRVLIEQMLVSIKERCTIIMISHYQDQIKRIADKVFELKDTGLVNC